jgi:hypothetical protein
MAGGTLKRISGPAYFSNAAANIYTPPASTIYTIIRHIHIANVTTGAITFSLYVGATGGSAGGTQLFGTRSVPANSEMDYFCTLFMASTDFLSGIASAASSLTITVEGEQGVV